MHRSRFATSIVAVSLVALLGVTPAFAQSIAGTVQSGGRPVAGATVRLLELDRIEHSGTGGRFTFSDVPRGSYSIFVESVGYASQRQRVQLAGASASLSVDLRPSAVPLRAVVVSASPEPRATDEAYQATASKSQVELLDTPGATFAEKLSDIPGVAVRSLGSAPSRPILRGLGDNEVLILENGLRMGDIATFDPAHATPIEAIGISEIDVVRGPSTILYGPSTIGGIVNVITSMVPSVSSRAVSGSVAFEGNSVSDQAAGYVNNVISGANQAFRVSAGGVHAQNIRIPGGAYTDPESGVALDLDRMPQSFDRSSEFGAGYAYQGTRGMIGIGAKHYQVNYGIPGVPANPDFVDLPPTTSRIAQRRNTLEVRSLLDGGSSLFRQVKLTANYNDYNHAEFPTAQDETGVSEPQANHFHKRQFNGILQLQHRPLGRLQGTLGLWSNIEDLAISGDQPLGPNSLTTGLAAYAYEEFIANPETRLQGGLRFDYNKIQTRPYGLSTDSVFRTTDESRLSNAVTASVGAVRHLTGGLTGSFSVARSFRAPSVQELFANGLDAPSGTYTIGTATLSPETGLGVDASLRGAFSHGLFELSPYVNVINHYIYGFLRGDVIEDFPVRQFTSTSARLTGFEASVVVEPADHFAVRASTDYVRAEDTNAKVPLPFTPPLRGLVRGTYQDQSYMAMVEWRGAAKQSRLGEGDTPTAGYGIANIGAGVRFVMQGRVSNISLHCDNLFNRVYRDNLSVIKDFLPQPARGFRLNYELVY